MKLISNISMGHVVALQPTERHTRSQHYPRLLLAAFLSIAFLTMCARVVTAQSVSNVYTAGIAYNPNATPAVAGSALYAHKISDAGTYAFTVLDILPSSGTPKTVSTNIGAGVAQRVVTIAGHDIFSPIGAGVAVNGTNLGWNWSGGVTTFFKVKPTSDGGAWYLEPDLRYLKSSVSGYQVIAGFRVGWGK